MPHTDANVACELVRRMMPEVPAWPQLPRRSFLENMNAQFSEGFPGLVIDGDSMHVNRGADLSEALERFYEAFLADDVDKFSVSAEYAAGLHRFLELDGFHPALVKGQVTGPVTWAASVTDENRRALIWDDTLADAAAKHLRMKAAWQESVLKNISPNTIIFIDEPYLEAYGSSPLISLSRETVITLLNEVLGGISGPAGVHCCGKTDWSVLLKCNLDILSFDTYTYADSLSLFPEEVKALVDRGGTVAWGIVPNTGDSLERETAASLKDRLEDAMAPYTRHGVPFRTIVAQSLLTPSCSLAGLAPEAAETVLELLAGLSGMMRSKYT